MLLMVSSNLLMAFYLLKALEKNESVTVTVISSASNLLFSVYLPVFKFVTTALSMFFYEQGFDGVRRPRRSHRSLLDGRQCIHKLRCPAGAVVPTHTRIDQTVTSLSAKCHPKCALCFCTCTPLGASKSDKHSPCSPAHSLQFLITVCYSWKCGI